MNRTAPPGRSSQDPLGWHRGILTLEIIMIRKKMFIEMMVVINNSNANEFQ